ncbi:hypothetical protein DBP15_02000 [Streptomyces sp. CS065A]|nr:hypothetical protein DBP15_02000 [Streptomyces sp. CS065A]
MRGSRFGSLWWVLTRRGRLHRHQLPWRTDGAAGFFACLTDPVGSDSAEGGVGLGLPLTATSEGVVDDGVDREVLIFQAAPGPDGSPTPLVPCSPEGLLRLRSQPGEAGVCGELRLGQDTHGSRLQQADRLHEGREGPTLLVEGRGEATLETIGPGGEEGVLGHGLVAPCQVGVQPTPVLVTSGAEVAGAVVSLPFFVVPGLVVFLLLVAGFGGAGWVLGDGEGGGGVTLGLEVLLVLGPRSS